MTGGLMRTLRRQAIWDKTDGRCFYCPKYLLHDHHFDIGGAFAWAADGDLVMQVDHGTPRNRGGSDGHENHFPSCRSCNSKKNQKTQAEFFSYLFAQNTLPRFFGTNLAKRDWILIHAPIDRMAA